MTIGKKDYAIYDKSCLKEGDRLETEYKEDCVIYRLSNDSGTGTVTEYPVFDGVSLLIDDMHMYAFGEGSSGSAMLVIEHCKEGRFEADFADGRQFYIGKGDICVHNMDYGEILFSAMPIRHYHGVTVMIRHDRDEEFCSMLKSVGVDLNETVKRTEREGNVYLIRATERIQHIFEEIYQAKGAARKGYFRIKLLELLLFLNSSDGEPEKIKNHLLPRENADILKKSELYIWDNLDKQLTVEKLSANAGMSPTSFKTQFRILYGCPVHKYVNICRMQVAQYKLVRTEEKIADIARQVGYVSESKFSQSFVRFSGVTPREYRKNAVLSDWDIVSPYRV